MGKLHKNAAIVYWIEAGSGNLLSRVMEPHDLRGGGTYESEVRLKYALNPLEMATICLRRAGNDWEKGEVERLRAKSQAMRAERREKRTNDDSLRPLDQAGAPSHRTLSPASRFGEIAV
jgi:hypothetical protein